MTKLPDPRPNADASVLAEMKRMAHVRSHAEAVQRNLTEAVGDAGVVELVVLCGCTQRWGT